MPERIPAQLLIVEDEKNVGSTLVERFRAEKYEVVWAQTVAEAEQAIEKKTFDLALLDVGLPDGSGFDVAETIREKQRAMAIIFLTAFGNPDDRVRGLELGAEDYIVKPFHLKELLLRVEIGLRRARYLMNSGDHEGVRVGRATVYFSRFEARVKEGAAEKTCSLTHKECALLKLLVERRGQVVSRDDILNQIWSEEDFPTPRTVDNFIVRLRRIIELNPDEPQVIRSIRGVGYQMSVDEP